MKQFLLISVIMLFFQRLAAQNTLTATYTLGDIPTSYDSYDDSCNGPSSILSVSLPPGDNYTVTSVDVSYEMTALGSGKKSDQRSFIKFQNTNLEESSETFGKTNSTGTYSYARTTSIANGKYSGGTELIFEMKARRTAEGVPGCNTSVNRVDATTWTIIIHYNDEVRNPKIGINKTSPSQSMDVKGKLKLSDDNTAPEAGTIRWNHTKNDFEGYNGTEWLSFTKNKGDSWGNKDITENSSGNPYDGSENDRIGYAVSIDGDYAVIGAIGQNNNQGKAYIFKNESWGWELQAPIVSSDGLSSDQFGTSVSISGEYVIIGASNKTVGTNPSQGKAYIFKRTGNTWDEEASLISPDGQSNDNFGSSVSISGDYAIVGAPLKDFGANDNQGKVYVFKRSGTTWTEQASFLAFDGSQYDQFGDAVSISGDYAIIGVQRKDIGANLDQGKAYIFKRSGTEWLLHSDFTASDGSANYYFGNSVSIDGNHAIVGAFQANGAISYQGKAYIFKRSGNSWTEEVDIAASDGLSGDSFGTCVAISGNYAVIGANYKKVHGKNNQGKAYIFKRTGQHWSEQVGIISSDGKSGDFFATSCSISDHNIIVGAPNVEVDEKPYQGKVYFFNKTEEE